MILRTSIAEQSSRPAIGCYKHIERAVIIDMAVGRASCNAGRGESTPSGCRLPFEFPIAEIMKKVRRLRVSPARLHAFDGVFNMAVRNIDIQPAIEVVVKKETPESKRQQTRVAHVRLRRVVHKQPIALVMVKCKHLVRKIRDEHARISGTIVISGVHAHSGASDSVLAVSDARLHAFFRKCSVSVIYVKLVRLRIVAYQNVRPAVLIRVENCHAQALRGRVVQPGFLSRILERSIATIVPETYRTPLI